MATIGHNSLVVLHSIIPYYGHIVLIVSVWIKYEQFLPWATDVDAIGLSSFGSS
jgi:hypothetical protein